MQVALAVDPGRLLTFCQFEEQFGETLKLVSSVEMNTKHYVELMSRAVDSLLPPPSADVTYDLLAPASSPPC